MNVENHAAAVVGVLGVFQRGTDQHFIELDDIGIVPWGKYDNGPEKKFKITA
jgi:hypothetical protein